MVKYAVSFADTFFDLNYVEIVEAYEEMEAIAKHSMSKLSIDDMINKNIYTYQQAITHYRDNYFTLIGIKKV
jgi:hypothetical protein